MFSYLVRLVLPTPSLYFHNFTNHACLFISPYGSQNLTESLSNAYLGAGRIDTLRGRGLLLQPLAHLPVCLNRIYVPQQRVKGPSSTAAALLSRASRLICLS